MTDKIERLKLLDSEKLIDVVKNYRQYGYDEKLRNSVVEILENRGIDKEQLKLTGNFENRTYDLAQDIYAAFGRNSKIALIFYGILLITNILWQIAMRNSEVLGMMTLITFFGSLVLYFVFLVKSFMDQYQFYKAIGKEYGSEGALLYLFLGIPFYIFSYFYFRNQMNEQMKMIK